MPIVTMGENRLEKSTISVFLTIVWYYLPEI